MQKMYTVGEHGRTKCRINTDTFSQMSIMKKRKRLT